MRPRVENLTLHGVDVKVTYGDPLNQYRGTAIEIGGDGWSRVVRDMDHRNVLEDVAHEVRVWLIRWHRKTLTLAKAKGWKVAA